MSFTDEDLKRLKVHLETDKEFHENATWVEHIHMDALLARLEAAERVCVDARQINQLERWVELSSSLAAWLKSKGGPDAK